MVSRLCERLFSLVKQSQFDNTLNGCCAVAAVSAMQRYSLRDGGKVIKLAFPVSPTAVTLTVWWTISERLTG